MFYPVSLNIQNISNTIFVRKPEGKIPTGKPRSKWENVRMDLMENRVGGVDWVHGPTGVGLL
jgi:hypothetical protein